MRRIATMLSILAVSLLISAMPALTAEVSMPNMGVAVQKDECLLIAKNCTDNLDSIVQKIDRIEREIGRGTNVYSTDELRVLKGKLDENYKVLFELTSNGG